MKRLLFLFLLLPFIGVAQTSVSNNFQVNAPKAIDNRTGKFVSGIWQPYSSVSDANTTILSAYRHKGLTVLVSVSGVPTEYWYRAGIADGDLVVKSTAGGAGTVTSVGVSVPSAFTASSPVTTSGTIAISATGGSTQFINGAGALELKSNLPISSATQTALDGKQGNLTAGSGISLVGNVISATGGGSSLESVTLYSMEGQSNNIGVGYTSELAALNYPDDLTEVFRRVYIFNPATNVNEPLKVYVNNQAAWDSASCVPYGTNPNSTFGPELGIAYRWIKQNATGKLFIMKNSGNGQSISFFQKGGAYYARLLARHATFNAWLTAHGYVVKDRAWVWVQGEGDAAGTQSAYRTALNTLIADRKADGVITNDTRIVLSQINPVSGGYNAGISAAKSTYAADSPNVSLIYYTNNFNSDVIHLNALGQMQLGYDAFWRGFAVDRILADNSGTPPSESFPSAGLVAYYKLNETTGDYTSTLGTFPLTRTGAVASDSGKIGNSALFTGASGQALSGSASSSLSLTSAGFTMAFWVKPDLSTSIQSIVSKGTGAAANLEYALYVDVGGSVIHTLVTVNGGFSGSVDGTIAFTTGQYVFVVFKYDGAGVFSTSINNGSFINNAVSAPYNGAGIYSIGAPFNNSGGTPSFGGNVDEVGIWGRVLSNSEITYLYNAGAGRTP